MDAPATVGGAARIRQPVSPTQAEIDAGFDEWWAHYPRKVDKLDAKRAYVAIVSGKHRDPDHHATIPQLLAALKAHKFPNDPQFIKHPATWLNKGAWTDFVARSKPLSLEEEIQQLAESEDGKTLLKEKGAEEGMHLLRELVIKSRKGCPQ